MKPVLPSPIHRTTGVNLLILVPDCNKPNAVWGRVKLLVVNCMSAMTRPYWRTIILESRQRQCLFMDTIILLLYILNILLTP